MSVPRYPQFCALARAAEIVGERWTLLIVRELLLGPKRFSDLRDRLDGVSTSVLTERLARLEEMGLVRRAYLPPPAASQVYELTADGQALRPAVFELVRWGARRLLPPRADERIEPDWVRLALAACARRSATPARSFVVRITGDGRPVSVHIAGGPGGTAVTDGEGQADATLAADARTVLGLMSGVLSPAEAVGAGRVVLAGSHAALADFPLLFDVTMPEGATDASA